jgi:predicted NACHT family NTPase
VYDPITALRDAGFPVYQLSDSQREVLSSLTEEETAVVASVQRRLREAEADAEADVVAHDMKLL